MNGIRMQSLFNPGKKKITGIGYPNVHDVLRASDEIVHTAIKPYEQRCGHIPLDDVEKSYVLVSGRTNENISQFQYLSALFKKTIEPRTAGEILSTQKNKAGFAPLIVPYIKVSETEEFINREIASARIWGLPAVVVDNLKNKAESHQIIHDSGIEGLNVPDFEVVRIDELVDRAGEFLQNKVVNLYQKFSISDYSPGMMLRFAECDGNYGAAMLKSQNGKVSLLPDGNSEKMLLFDSWDEALRESSRHIKSAMNLAKETRVVITRLIDSADSPAMSVAVLDGEIVSLGFNGQLQGEGTACIGTSTLSPKSEYLQKNQAQFEEESLIAFSKLLKQIARANLLDFNSFRGFASIDIIIPGELERQLQTKRFGAPCNYFSECNPRITNWTDALLTGVAVERLPQTIDSMAKIITRGIQAVDKFKIPPGTDLPSLRDKIFNLDRKLEDEGTRVIVRMCANPMGIIFMGNYEKARNELSALISQLA